MIQLYCAGGTGTNIGKQIADLDMDMCFIDTSTSNLKTVNPDLIFITPETDGGGKDRSLVHGKFKDYVEDILIRFKPSDQLNIVVSSLSGGSGAVISPMITKELITKGYNVIVIAVDSKHSLKELDNTVKTLKTFQSFSSMTKKAISLFYVDNTTRKEADQQAIRFINLLSLLVDKAKNEEFDTADMFSFLNFDKVTDNSPTVSILEVNTNESLVPEKNTNVVGTILVTTNRQSTLSQPKPEYLATCIVTDASYHNEDIRIDSVVGKLSIIVSGLETQVKDHQDHKRINKFKELEVTANTTDGLVL